MNLFAALLPPMDPEEPSFYEILQVERDACNDDIRKAYKKLSLKLHPDKVAQRGESKIEEAAAEYEKVQEAYAVLVNEEKREKYNVLGSPTRYRFVAKGAIASPGALYENLAGASFVDKTRLMIFMTTIILVILTQPILIAAKINQSLEDQGALQDTSWLVILIPYWIIGGLIMIVSLMIIPFVPVGERLPICLFLVEQFLWYLGTIFMSLRWDGTWTSAYRRIFIPIYIAMVFRWTQSLLVLWKVRRDVTRMVTVEFLEREVLKGKSLEELDESELDDIRKKFLVVTVAPDFVPVTDESAALEEEKLEEQKVEASPEFEAATEIYNSTFGGLVTSVVFVSIFLILLTRKLDGHIAASWWAVFVPVWIERGTRWILNLYHCACGSVAVDEIHLTMKPEKEEDGKGNNNGEKKGDEKEVDEDDDEGAEDEKGDVEKGSLKQFSRPKLESTAPDAQGNNPISMTKAEGQKCKDTPSKEDEGVIGTESKQGSVVDVDMHKENELSSVTPDDGVRSSATNMSDNGIEKDDEEYIHLDEETFHAWQSAYEQAEENAMQQQAKSSSECCSLTLQLILLSLVVAKIQQNWGDANPDDPGFNVFWILFPFFLFFGVACCCCAIMIYGASPGTESDLQDGPEAKASNGESLDIENPPTSLPTVVPHLPEEDEVGGITEPEKLASENVDSVCASDAGAGNASGTCTDEKPEPTGKMPGLNMDDLD